MPRHLFLTGQKHIGKSTLLEKLLTEATGSVGGFRTQRSTTVFPGQATTHLLSARTGEEPGEGNFLFFCGGKDPEAAQRFDRLGTEALSMSADLIVMDELGPHEEKAERFCSRVRELLDGDVPIIGVLQQADSEFLRSIAHHPQVQLVTVTEENRDSLADLLCNRYE